MPGKHIRRPDTMTDNTPTVPEPRTTSVEEAARLYGISRTLAYELARRNELPGCLKFGSRFVVSRAVIDRVLNGEG